MKLKILTFILLIPILSFSQTPQKFIIGADWFNNLHNQSASLGTNYWELGRDFGLNFATLNLEMTDANIITELQNAQKYQIDIELNSKKIYHGDMGLKRSRRWLYQIEGNYDFYYLSGSAVHRRAVDAEPHWKYKDPSSLDPLPNYVHLTPQGSVYTLVENLKKELKTEIPDYSALDDKLTMKVRLRTFNVTGDPVTDKKVAFKYTLTVGNDEYSGDIEVSSSNNEGWKEISVMSFDKKTPPVSPAIPNSSQPLLIRNENGGMMGIPEFTLTPKPEYTPMNIKIDYQGTVECDIDYIAFDDVGADLIYKGTYDALITGEVEKFWAQPALKFLKVKDEIAPDWAYPVGYVCKKVDERFRFHNVSDKSGTAIHYFDPPITYDFDTQQFLGKTEVKFHKMDYYPLNLSVESPTISDVNIYTTSVQSAFDNNLVNKFEDVASVINRFKRPWMFEVQAHSWRKPADGQLREPSPYEIKAMCNLSIAFGAKGILYFMYTKPSFPGEEVNALLDDASVTDPIPRLTDEHGYAKWETLKSYNQKLKSIGDELLKLNWTNSWYIHGLTQPTNTFISNVRSSSNPMIAQGSSNNSVINNSVMESPDGTHIQLSTFTSGEPPIPNLDYIYVVNRRTHKDDRRFISITLNKSNSPFENWNIKEIGSTREWNIGKTGTFDITLEPGDAGLYKIEPVLIAGGSIVIDETAPAGQTGVKGTITVNESHSLTIPPGASMTFNNRAALIVNGHLLSGSSSSSPVTMDFSSGGNGITVSEAGMLTMNNTKIMNAITGVSIKSQNANTITSCEIFNCTDGINIYPTGNATITGTKIWTMGLINSGIYVQSPTNTISDCDISGCDVAGIWYDQLGNNYSGASIPILTNNKIHDNSHGIYFNIASVAYVTNNEIYNNLNTGAFAYSSSPAFGYANHPGKNYIRNNGVGIWAYDNANPFFGRNTYYNYGGY